MNQVWKTLYEQEHRSLGKNGEATLTPLWSKSPKRRGALLKVSHLGELSIKDSPPNSMMENHHSSRLLQSTRKSPVCVCNRRKQGQVKISLEQPQKEESEPMHKVYLSQNPQIQGAFYFLVSIYQSEAKETKQWAWNKGSHCHPCLLPSWGCFEKDHCLYLEMPHSFRLRKLSLGAHLGRKRKA